MKTNCDNCGAVLPPDGHCEYCGTWWEEQEKVEVLYSDGIPYAYYSPYSMPHEICSMVARGIISHNEYRQMVEDKISRWRALATCGTFDWPSPKPLETR